MTSARVAASSSPSWWTDPGVTLHEGDVLDEQLLRRAFEGCDWVFHLQANADVRHGLEHPRQDLEQNTIATAAVLEAMRAEDVTRIAFSSTGSVYGEPELFPTPEDAPFPLQTSLYAASKLAGEGMIGAYAHGFGFTGVVLRFVSILGERYTHGHVYDFYCALKRDPTGCACWATDVRRSPTCTSKTASPESSPRPRPTSPDRESWASTTWARDETVVVDDSLGVITRAHGCLAGDRVHGRPARMGR